MKKIALFILCFAALAVFGDAGLVVPPGWEPMAGTQHNMSLYAQVEDFDWKKALDAAIAKTETQIGKYLEKKQDHRDRENIREEN